MIPARKRWGQHFLTRGATAQRIVDAAGVSATDTVVEVGPGEGALTRPLAERAGRLLAIEIDPRRAEALREEIDDGERVRVLTGDVLERPFGQWLEDVGWEGPALLVANLPYNAATPILLAALEERGVIRRAVATVQREVAERFVAKPGDAGYGFLSVRAAAAATGRILFDLPPAAFRPRPKVTSSVLELEPRRPAFDEDLARRAVRLASRGFQARRKTLANALSGGRGRAPWEDAIARLGRPPTVRAEELSLEDYIALARLAPAGSLSS
jgi:16S rRNA (adenine1518-N6/adenine1519-N6)-dimethyltransferase